MEAYLNEKKLKDYLGGKLVCREERKFALFLYLAFLEKKKGNLDPWLTKQVKSCLEEKERDPIIEEVYYEATLMRDYFAGCKIKKRFRSGGVQSRPFTFLPGFSALW